MEDAKDPDEYIKKFGAMRFGQLLSRSGGAIEYELSKCRNGLDISTDEGRIEYLKRCVKLFADISSPIEREVYIGRVSDETKVSKEMLFQQVNGAIKKRIDQDKKREWTDIRTFQNELRRDPDAYRHSKEYKAETGILSFLAAYPEETEYVASKISPDDFVTDFNKKVYDAILKKSKISGFYDILSLQSEFTADEMGKITEIAVNSKDVNINKTAVNDFIKFLTDRADNPQDVNALSDDDFRSYFNGLKKRK